MGKTIGREHEEPPKSQIGRESGSKFSNWLNGERSEMEWFWRKPRADLENVRFSTLNSKYTDEGSSNGYSSNYMESLVLSRFMAYTDFFFYY